MDVEISKKIMSNWVTKKSTPSIKCDKSIDKRDCPRDLRILDRYVNRAGVIPYSVVEGQIYVLLGRQYYEDRKYNVWGDFGGGCSRNKNESAIECARREYNEETRGLLQVDMYDATHVYLSKVRQERYKENRSGASKYFTSKQLVMFVPVDIDWSLPIRFSQKKPKTKAESEMEGIRWFKVQDLKNLRDDKISPALKSIIWFDLLNDRKKTKTMKMTNTQKMQNATGNTSEAKIDYIMSIIDNDNEEFGIGVDERIDIFKKYIGPVPVKQLPKMYSYQINIGKYIEGDYHLDVSYQKYEDDEYKFLKSVKLEPEYVRDIIKSLLAASVEITDVDGRIIR